MARSSDMLVQLCGRLVVRLGGRDVASALPGRQGRLLLAYLVLRRLQPVGRDEIVAALWPGRPPSAAAAAVSALLSKLRRELGPGVLAGGRGAVRLALPAEVWIDVEAADEATHRAESAVALGDWTGAWAPARVAEAIGRRPFLPGDHAPWIDERRAHLREVRVRALECIGSAALGLGGTELAAAARSGRALIALEPFRETGYRLAMEAHAARGDVAEALRVYERLRRLLRDELGVGPGAAVRELHARLLAARVAHTA